MANSQSVIREIRIVFADPEGQGAADVYAFSHCPDFPPAHGWRHATCPADRPFIDWLKANIGNYLHWAPGTPA